MNTVVPAILVHDEAAFRDRLRLVERLAPVIQIDVMDGAFVPNRTWYDPGVLRSIDTPASFELHLMVEDPDPVVRDACGIPSVRRVVWHVESMGDHRELLNLCRSNGREGGLAISPKSPQDVLAPYVGRMDEILVLGVEPGFSGQKLIPDTVEKVRAIHAAWPDIPIAFDGGVTASSIPMLREAGVSRFCAASALFDATDIEAAFGDLAKA